MVSPIGGTLWLGGYTRARHQLTFSFGVDELRFATSYWYGDVDLHELEARYGLGIMETIYAHIALFEANKLASLRPDVLDLGPFAAWITPELADLWTIVFHNVWAQWRYEHDLPRYQGPQLTPASSPRSVGPVDAQLGQVEVLSFCGGGKDSLVAMKLLEAAGLTYSTLAYSSSVYGTAATQHALIDGLVDRGKAVRRHRLWMYDDFMDAPVAQLHPELGVHSVLAAETPSSAFAALPLVLQHGYAYLSLAHERSADLGNLRWAVTGEDVNHQWGKSAEAERLLRDYIRAHLIGNTTYFSLLKPLYDVLIFNMLRACEADVPSTHSCNVAKPWCGTCPKCAYVWLNYMAYLPEPLVDGIFKRNLLDVPENQLGYRQMLGLEDHTPFECIGQVDEVRLAFELCRRKGITGRAMDAFVREVPPVDVAAIARRYLVVDEAHAAIPPEIARRVVPIMRAAAEKALGDVQRVGSRADYSDP